MKRMRNWALALTFTAAAGLGITACKHEPQIPAEPEISFKKDIQPIILGNCTQSGCHGQENPQELTLLNYNDVRQQVRPGRPFDSELYEMITETDPEERMPLDRPPLSAKSIQLIELWIGQGAKDN